MTGEPDDQLSAHEQSPSSSKSDQHDSTAVRRSSARVKRDSWSSPGLVADGGSYDGHASSERRSRDERPSDEQQGLSSSLLTAPPHPSGRRRSSVAGIMGPKTQAAFVQKLHTMVSTASLRDYLSWTDDGTAFVVYNPNQFAATVLPQFFKHSNFQSFVRQLNMYGFRKVNDIFSGAPTPTISKNLVSWEFSHTYFVRDRPDLLPLIKRKPSKSNSNSAAPAPSSPSDSPRSSRNSSLEPPPGPQHDHRLVSREYDRPRPSSSSETVSKRQRIGWPEDDRVSSSAPPYSVGPREAEPGRLHPVPSSSRASHPPSSAFPGGYPSREQHSSGQYRPSPTSSAPFRFAPPGGAPPGPHPPSNHTSTDLASQVAGLEDQVRGLTQAFHRSREDAMAERTSTASVLRLLVNVVTGIDSAGDRRDELEQAHIAIASLDPSWSPQGSSRASGTFPPPFWDGRRPHSSQTRPPSMSSQPYFASRTAESFARHRSDADDASTTPHLSNAGSFSTASSEATPNPGSSRPYLFGRSPNQGNFVVLPRPGSSSDQIPTSNASAPAVKSDLDWPPGRLPPLASVTGLGDIFRRRGTEGVEEGRAPWER